jgi:outer membrane protein assembly factor BamD (BamD/ComL family)
MKRVINLLILSVLFVLNANAQDCDVPKKETQKFFDSASANIRKKYYITASSYFKAADDIRNQYPNCELYNDEMASLAAGIANAATYQTLIEQVITMQDQELYQDAYNKYMVAGTYFQKFQVSEHGLSHDSIVAFILYYACSSYIPLALPDSDRGKRPPQPQPAPKAIEL